MSFADANPGYAITTQEQAISWMQELIEGVRKARVEVNGAVLVREQKKLWERLLMKHGGALGSLMALHRAGRLSDVAYNELREEVMRCLLPALQKGVRG